MNKPEFCNRCPITKFTTGYCANEIKPDTTVLYVGEAPGSTEVIKNRPFVGGAGRILDSLLKVAGLSRETISIANVIGCHPPDNGFPGDKDWIYTDRYTAFQAIDYCRQNHLQPALKSRKWSRIVALGNQALRALTNKSGILLWRGSPLQLRDAPLRGPLVLPTLHPAYLMRNSTLFSAARSDLQRSLAIPKENYVLWGGLAELRQWKSKNFAFDLEWDANGRITLVGLADRFYSGIVVGFDDADIRAELKRIFEEATDLIGHNIIGADLPHFKKLGWNVTAKYHDTMLKQHLVQPDYKHDLGFVASMFTNRVFWKGKGEEDEDADNYGNRTTHEQWRTWNDPANGIPIQYGGYYGCASADEAYRLYNARDTAASYEINTPLDTRLSKYSLDSLYWNVSVPVAKICQELGEVGFKIDPLKVAEVRNQLSKEIEQLEKELPEGLRPETLAVNKRIEAPPECYKLKKRKCKGLKRDGTAHDTEEITFSHPGQQLPCPKCGRNFDPGKMVRLKYITKPSTKIVRPWNSPTAVLAYAKSIGCKSVEHKKTKKETSDKSARKVWGRKHTEFALVDQLKKLSVLRNSFAKEGLTKTDRMYFNLLVHGTGEGRLSSTAKRKYIDLNVQNIPESARILFLPDQDGWFIANVDWKSGENCLTAWLAQDFERLERLRSPGYDEHAELASRVFNCLVTKKNENAWLRAAGKVINHGLNYGMGVFHMQADLSDQGFNYTIGDVREMIEEWKKLNPGTARWQAKTIRIAQQQSYLENVFGRKRWFTDRGFATKALAFLPASTLADMMLRCMIALHSDRFANELNALGVKVRGNLPEHCRLITQVHDSMVITGPPEERESALNVVGQIMTQKFDELGGFALEVDVGCSFENWGGCK